MRHLMIVLLLSVVLTGCFGGGDDDTASQDPEPIGSYLHEVSEMLPFETTAEDGTALRGHVYLPNGTGPFPTVLELSPYWNTRTHSEDLIVETGDGRRSLGLWLGPFIDAGFAVALVNLRGTGESGECMQWGGPADVSDAVTVVEAISNASWSDRTVGMYGASYEGWSQFMAMAGAAPSLKAAIPISPVVDLYSVTIYRGAPSMVHGYMWPLWTAGAGAGAFGLVNTNLAGARPEPQVPDVSPDHLACPRYVNDLDAIAQAGADGDRSSYYGTRDLRPAIAAAPPVPTLVVNGLTNLEGSIYQIDGLWEVLDVEHSRFLLGQWDHAWPLTTVAHVDFNAEYAVPWFDQHLRDGPEHLEGGVVEVQDDSGQWHEKTAWPPEGDRLKLYLSDRSLVPSGEEIRTSAQMFQSTGDDVDPSDCPGIKAIYVSPPLAEEVVFAGHIEANLTMSSTGPDGNLAVYLWHDRAPWACGDDPGTDEDYEVTRAFSDLAHRGHLDAGRPYPLGEPDVIHMTSEAFASRIPAGERLILTVSGGDNQLLPDAHKPTLTVHTDPDVEGELVLNVVEGELSFADDEEYEQVGTAVEVVS